ncbi:hypothetical protein GVN24_16115 [Rhizobium sp. CRIBSB]|nr:hypothetical protein [Rhizobium sp. CRIBSB]
MSTVAMTCVLTVFLAQETAACENEWRKIRANLGDFVRNESMGDVAIGSAYKSGKPRRFLILRESGCYEIEKGALRNRDLATFWINNVGDWSDRPKGTFVSIHATTLMASESQPAVKFLRNGNSASRAMHWYRKSADGSYSAANKEYAREFDDVETLYGSNDPEAFEKNVPGLDANVVDKDDVAPSDQNRLWTFFKRNKPKTSMVEKIQGTGYKLRHRHYALAFDGRQTEAGEGNLVKFEINASAECLYLNIDSPIEEFDRNYIIQVEGSELECENLRNTKPIMKSNADKKIGLLAFLFGAVN